VSFSSRLLRQAVRDRVAALVLPSGLPEGWTALRDSKEVYPHWRRVLRSPVHLEFCIGAASSAPEPMRQRTGVGGMTREEMVVGVSVQLRPGADAEVDGDALLDLERAIRDWLLISWSPSVRTLWSSSERTPGPEGWLYSEIRLVCLWTDSLSS
jgi:hypothetical protein